MAERAGQALIIKNLVPSLTEIGKIKIGEKGRMITSKGGKDFQPPKKLEHFKVVSLYRGEDGNFFRDNAVHDLYGEKPTELPVRLLFDDIELNFQCRYSCYKGRVQWCAGDGEYAWRIENNERKAYNCPCHRQNPEYQGPDKCKINGCLSVLIDGIASIGGVWKFRTTSYNTVTGLLSSLTLIKSITGGPLAGIPLTLKIAPKTVISPTDNRIQTVFVVGLEYKGSFEKLQDLGYNKALDRQKHITRMDDIENQARKLLSIDTDIVDEDVVEEFYPEQVWDETEGQQGTVESQEHIEEDLATQFQQEIIQPALSNHQIPREGVIAYVVHLALEYELSQDRVKEQALKEKVGFIKALKKWYAEQTPKKPLDQDQGKEEPVESPSALSPSAMSSGPNGSEPKGLQVDREPEDPDEKYIKEFKNLRKGKNGKTGLKAYVAQNLERVWKTYPESVREKLIAKYNDFYPGETFPLLPEEKPTEDPKGEPAHGEGKGKPDYLSEDRPPPFENPFTKKDGDNNGGDGGEAAKTIAEGIHKSQELLNSFENAVTAAFMDLETDLPVTPDHLEKFLDEQAHLRSRTKGEIKESIMKYNRFQSMWDEFMAYVRGDQQG